MFQNVQPKLPQEGGQVKRVLPVLLQKVHPNRPEHVREEVMRHRRVGSEVDPNQSWVPRYPRLGVNRPDHRADDELRAPSNGHLRPIVGVE